MVAKVFTTKRLLTEREVCMEKYQTEIFDGNLLKS